ncbi:hypothetical protein BDF14DRAFT_1873856 [Spinellus fusiger]|nr:hypothetical protein BDF14DRAFT_1873856 [Spinellus fusiger]
MTRFTLPAIVAAISMVALAQAQDGACSGSINPVSQADLEAIKGCRIFNGSIIIDASKEAFLALNGVEEITGDLTVQGSSDLKSFGAPQLKSVGGELKITNNTVLERADFPGLTQAKTLILAILPGLQVIQFPSVLSKVSSARIEDTRAPTILGFSPEVMDSFTLTNNNYMKQFDLSSVKDMTGTLFVTSNGQGLDFGATNLLSVRSATFRNLAHLTMPQLQRVTGELSFHQNDFDSLALDNLETIGGTVTLANNNRLVETSFKNLAQIGGALSVGNNTQLKTIDGFTKLARVDGTIDMAGAFDTYKLPSIQDVRGGMRVQTSSGTFPCSDLEKQMKTDNVVKGTIWNCASSMSESQMIPTLGQEVDGVPGQSYSSGGSGSSSSGSSSSGSGSSSSSGSSSGLRSKYERMYSLE